MSTSSKIGSALGISDIPINYRYCELMREEMYAENPIPRLGLRTKGLDELKISAGMHAFNFTDDEEGYAYAS